MSLIYFNRPTHTGFDRLSTLESITVKQIVNLYKYMIDFKNYKENIVRINYKVSINCSKTSKTVSSV